MTAKTTKTRTMTPSWELYRSNLQLVRTHYLGVIYLFFLPSLLAALGSTLIGRPEAVNGQLHLSSAQAYGLVLLGASILWQIINVGPLTYFQLRALGGKIESIGTYYRNGLGYDMQLVLYYIVYGVLVLLGLLLFIVPGLYVMRRYFLANYYLIDKQLPLGQALQRSAQQSKPYSGAIWGVIGVQVALVFAAAFVQSALPLIGIIIGELIACSYLFLSVLRYREIEPRKVS